jgi:hypothetical protein
MYLILMQIENEKKKKVEEEAVPTEIEVQATRIQGEDGNVYMMISKQNKRVCVSKVC